MMHTAFPDMKLAVEQLSADEDTVSFAYRITGTQKGVFMGFPASGNAIVLRIAKFSF